MSDSIVTSSEGLEYGMISDHAAIIAHVRSTPQEADAMHDYSVAGCTRTGTFYFLVAIAIGSAWLLDAIFRAVQHPIPWWADIISPAGCFTILFWLFDNCLWKWLSRINLFVPDFSGQWEGEIVATYRGRRSSSRMYVEIKQTWTQILISARTKRGNTDSTMAAITKDSTELRYEFMNEPVIPGPASPTHRGVGSLRMANRILQGGYYTQLSQTQNGAIALVRNDTDNSGS